VCVAGSAVRTDGGSWGVARCVIHTLADPDCDAAADFDADAAADFDADRAADLHADAAANSDADAVDPRGDGCRGLDRQAGVSVAR